VAQRAGGVIRPADLARTISGKFEVYEKSLGRAQAYLAALRATKPGEAYAPPAATYPKFQNYLNLYPQIGDAVFVRILVDQFINPDAGLLGPSEAAPEATPPWVNLAELRLMLSPWLLTDFVDVEATPKEQVAATLKAAGPLAIAVHDGVFAGIIDVERAARQILRQLAARSEG